MGIALSYDSVISISVGASRRSTSWTVLNVKISELYERLASPIRGVETIAEYLKLPKATQDNLKDVGGFVGGVLSAPRRKPENVVNRSLVTLDFDTVPPYGTQLIVDKLNELGCGYCIYSTRKHRPEAPRLRVIIPLDRPASPDEYDAVSRFVAGEVGIAMCDPTTFEVARLMYWSSCCKDSDVVFKYADRPLLPVERILDSYKDWTDYNERPQVPGEAQEAKRQAVKQGDPEGKPGVVGAFNKVYDIYSAMDKFLPGVYVPCAGGDPAGGEASRYTYAGGSTTGGAVIYENGKFLFSHHATDPCGGKLVNAFDMVRLHKFKDEDDDAAPGTPINRLPSYKSMCELAVADKSVAALIASERANSAVKDFQGIGSQISAQAAENGENEHFSEGSADTAETAIEWMKTLQIDPKSGRVLGTIDNILKILDNDPLLKDKFALNDFAGQVEVRGLLPWCTDGKRRMWSDTDSNGAYWYLERVYNITGRGNIDAALDVHASTHQFNEVQNYLKGLTWDGVPRLDTLFVDYLGAQDTEYNRAVCRKAFVAAVARAMTPGCKYDTMVILSGAQGIGKSTLIEKMAKGWFTGNIHSFEGKDASELLQGVWLVEVAELEALRKTDVARVKQFLSLRADRYRAAYGRNVKELPRRCIFFGTCNLKTFLQDTTGNRRFLPVDVGVIPHTKSAFEDLKPEEIDQLWAEAKARWQMGESLFLTGKLAEEAAERQEGHREVSAKEPMIVDFVYKRVPQEWLTWDISKRRDYWSGLVHGEFTLVPRDRICAQEVWCELFNGDIKACDKQTKREIDGILGSLIGYQYKPEPVRFGPYGLARGGYVTAGYKGGAK